MEELRRLNHAIDILRGLRPVDSSTSLAQSVALSPSYLNQLFKKKVGETPGQYRLRHRLRNIAIELKHHQSSVAGAGLRWGFQSSSELSHLFKKFYQLSPRDIQKGAHLCLNPTRLARRAKMDRFQRGFVPAGSSPPRVIKLPPMTLAYRRIFQAMQGCEVYESLLDALRWSREEQIPLFQPWGPLGICMDHFDLDPFHKFMFDVCVQLPHGYERPLPAEFRRLPLPGGEYAVIAFEGDLEAEEDALDYFRHGCLSSRKFQLDLSRPTLEVFLDEQSLFDWNKMKLELLFPICRI